MLFQADNYGVSLFKGQQNLSRDEVSARNDSTDLIILTAE